MDAAGSLRWGDGVMIRSQIPLSLPPVPPAHKKKKRKNLEAHLDERKACSCKWPRCQSSSGWRRESRSGLPESAIRGAHSSSPVLPRRERGVLLLQHNSLSLSNLMFDCWETTVVLESRRSWRLLLDEKFLEHQKWSIHVKKIKNKSHGDICPRSSLNNPPFVLWYSGLVFQSFLCFSRSQQHVWACCQLFPLISFTF